MMKLFGCGLAAIGGVVLSATTALAGPTYVFLTSQGAQVSNVGTVTLTQVNTTTVDVLVNLSDTTLPLPEYGFVNTGGPHTPFAFTVGGTEIGISANFIHPSQGVYSFGMFSLSTVDGSDTPYGAYGISINSTAGNGTSNAYFGNLEFQVVRSTGLNTNDFITNAAIDAGNSVPAYFAADLTNGSTTGSQAWAIRTTAVPEPASSALLGAGLLGIAAIARRHQSAWL